MRKVSMMFVIHLVMVCNVAAQSDISFQLISEKEQQTISKDTFGGISAIDFFSTQLMEPNLNNRTGVSQSLYLVSDHYPKSFFKSKHSYSFQLNADAKTCCPNLFFNLNDIECIRYNKRFNQLFFSFESDDETGIGFIDSIHEPVTLFSTCIPVSNRGIEGFTFTHENNLWFAYESGCKNSGNTIPFYFIVWDSTDIRKYNFDNRITYQYPFDKCYCLDTEDCPKFDERWGNGVSEILAIKNQPDKLLVLERCFDKGKKKGNSRLYLASLKPESELLIKELVYDFNRSSFVADNLEGMAWGEDESGYQVLYIVSDNNFNAGQKNQIIKLRMIEKAK